ncbi:MAG: IgGFc-binding protein, partial [Saprospiraceae bacterium]|nr:IgGFc-binding protein [Saprospiraceae bacterium]
MNQKIFRYALFACIFLTSNFIKLSAQTDTTFWFAAPDLNASYDNPIYLRVTALNKDAVVTISQPSNPSFTPIVQNVSAFSNYTFNLTSYLASVENAGADVITNYGILVTATQKILAYYEPSNTVNPDIFSLKGENALGTDFIILSQKKWNSYNTDKSAFYVVASEDNTVITVTPSVDLVGHTASAGAFTKTLNKGQVYVARATSSLGTNHVGGTEVTSTKKVAITMANDLTSPPGGCGDLNGDQMVPMTVAGQEFITLPGGLTVDGISDLVYIYATQNGTSVSVNGSSVATLSKGQYYELINYGSTNYITTNKPTLVYQVSGFGCEVGGGVIPALTCTGSTTVGITRASAEPLTLNILAKASSISNFKFNGSATVITAADFSDVPNTGGVWKYATKSINAGTLASGGGAIIKSTAPFHLAVINGGTTGGTRYGYFSGFGGFVPDMELTITNGLADMETDLDGTQYKWYRNGMVIPGATTKKYSTYASGTYKVEVTYDPICPPVTSNELKVA